jgi:predicted nucleic acid-binding protein
MILTDTSIVVALLRTKDPKLRQLIVAHNAAICGVTRAEILHGARDPNHRQQLLSVLNLFQHVPIVDSLWDEVGDHLAALRSAGVTVPFADAILTAVAISNSLELWTRDAHFALIQRVLPQLRLFVEPP